MRAVDSVLVVTALPDERPSTVTLGVIVDELERRPDVRVEVWFLRTFPEQDPWPGSRDVDSLRRWPVATWLERLVSRRAADLLRGLRLRLWFLRARPDLIVLDDGLGERLLTPRLRQGPHRPAIASRLNAEPPLHLSWEADPIVHPDLVLRAPNADEPEVRPEVRREAAHAADVLPAAHVRRYPESLRYRSDREGAAARHRLDLPTGELLVVGWGDDGWIDGPDLFVRALWALEHRHGVRANGVWLGLGSDRHEVERLHAEARRCGVGDRFFQRDDDSLAARLCADAAFLPYRDPGDPFDLMAALLGGLGVVTFAAAGVVDPIVIEVAPLDIEAAAAALVPLLAGDRDAVAAEARRRRRLDVVGDWVDELLDRSRRLR